MEYSAESLPPAVGSVHPAPSAAPAAIRNLRRRRRGYLEFYEQYDALIGLLCLSAHEGVKVGNEEEYRERRSFFMRRYAALKPAIQPHLISDADDAFPTLHGLRPCDAFEALFRPPTIAAMLAADGGNLIGRMMRTQAAIDAWDGALAAEERAHGVTPAPVPSPFRDKKTYRN